MKILLTGATGFMGSHVLKKLILGNYDVSVISRNKNDSKNWFQADILNIKETAKIIENVKPNILIHLAWDVTHGAFWHAENNKDYEKATKLLFSTFIKNGGKKIISVGTCAEYPTSSKAVIEDGEYAGELTPYGKAKRAIFDYLVSEYKKNKTEFTWLRIFGIFGEGEDERRFFPSAIQTIINNEPFEIKTPNCFYDYVYVKDIADCIIECVQREGLGAINIGTNNAISMYDLYMKIKYFIKKDTLRPILSVVVPDQNSRIPDCRKLEGYGFKFSLEAGLKSMINKNMEHYE